MKRSAIFLVTFFILFSGLGEYNSLLAQNSPEELNKKIYYLTTIGKLTEADRLNRELLSSIQEKKNSPYLNDYFINKIYIDANAKRLNNIVHNMTSIDEERLSPKDKMYFDLAVAAHFNSDNHSQIFIRELKQAAESKNGITDPDDISTWYNNKLFVLYYFNHDSHQKYDSIDYYLAAWSEILPSVSDLSHYRYLSKRISSPKATTSERIGLLEEMKEFITTLDDPYFEYFYYMLKYNYGVVSPEEKYSKENWQNLELAKTYLEQTELKNQDEYLYKNIIDYYEKNHDYKSIIRLESFLLENKIDEGNNDILFSLSDAHSQLGNKEKSKDLLATAYRNLKYNSLRKHSEDQMSLLSTLYNQKQLHREKNQISKERYLIGIVGILAFLILVAIYAINKVNTNKKLRSLYSELEQSNENLQEYISITTHDLRSPIASISNLSDPDFPNDTMTDMKNSMSVINSISKRSLDIVSSLLMFHNLKKKAPFDLKEINLSLLLDDVYKSMESLIKARRFEVQINVAEDLSILGNESLLRRMFQNFIENSLKFASKTSPPQITIEVAKDKPDEILVEIWDNGMGIPEDKLNYIFDKRYKIDKGSSGSGLGLTFCKEIVNYHKGIISVDSQIGRYTRFLLVFPSFDSYSVKDNKVTKNTTAPT